MAVLDDNQIYIASVVVTYWFVSISMVYLNKVLMSNEGISIPAPLFVTWFQCVVSTLICYLAGEVGEQLETMSSAEHSPLESFEELSSIGVGRTEHRRNRAKVECELGTKL